MRIINNTSKTVYLVNGKSVKRYSTLFIEKSEVDKDLNEQLLNLQSKRIITVITA